MMSAFGEIQTSASKDVTSDFDPGCVKTPSLNLYVEYPSQIRRREHQISPAGARRTRPQQLEAVTQDGKVVDSHGFVLDPEDE
jgi:hypothetical protein